MWRWDQGRLDYFEFDNLKKISKAAMRLDLRVANHNEIAEITGLPFSPQRESYLPWRNYSRVFKLMRLVEFKDGAVVASPVAELLASDGLVTSDEFIHYIVCSHTDPSPALDGRDWAASQSLRWPLLFALKYLLAVRKIDPSRTCSINEILAAYGSCNLTGDEEQSEFATFISTNKRIDLSQQNVTAVRQGRESLKFISQLSYLMMPDGRHINVNLSTDESIDTFEQLAAIPVNINEDPDTELIRLSSLFRDGGTQDFDYTRVQVQPIEHSGFVEGTKSERTHLVTERNSQLRNKYFTDNPTADCDLCRMETDKSYQWTKRVLDLHHILPLASGVRVDNSKGTVFDDLRPVCPTCHRAVHSYYSKFLKKENQKDFSTREEAIYVYQSVKNEFKGLRFVT